MAAAADRLVGDVFERLSPELVLVDAALSAEVRRHLEVPEDTLTRLGRLRVESRPPASGPREIETSEPVFVDLETPGPEAGVGVAQHESGIEDLIVISEDEPPPSRSTSRLYPTLPAPPRGDAEEEDATDVVLRQIRDHFEVEAPARRRRRGLSVASLAAALCAVGIFAVDVQLGLYELPRWLQI
jgi:hypothetical protein